MAALPLQVVEVTTADPTAARAALHELNSMRSLAQLGLRLHVLIAPDETDAVARVGKMLAARGLRAEVRLAAASLEDVFVGATMAAPANAQRSRP